MIRRTVGFLSLSLLIAAGFYLTFSFGKPQAQPQQKVFEPQLHPASYGLPSLDDEKSPYFSRLSKELADGGRLDTMVFRRDKSFAQLFYTKENRLRRVEAYRFENEQRQLAYEAGYDALGRRILKARYYDDKGKLQTLVERQADGAQMHSFYRGDELIRQVTLAADGVQTTVNYENGKATGTQTVAAQTQSEELFHWDDAKKQVRLRVFTANSRLTSWEYFKNDGTLEHKGKVLPDESLEFSFFEKDKLKIRQVWRLVGEDWERSYYGLFYSEAFADDGKSIEHKVWVRSNGSLKRHERFNAKTGKMEMHREFDMEGRVERIEDLTETGESKQVWVFPFGRVRSRGFVPTGMRTYPGGDEKIGYVYNLDGKPFMNSVLDPHPWALFEQVK